MKFSLKDSISFCHGIKRVGEGTVCHKKATSFLKYAIFCNNFDIPVWKGRNYLFDLEQKRYHPEISSNLKEKLLRGTVKI